MVEFAFLNRLLYREAGERPFSFLEREAGPEERPFDFSFLQRETGAEEATLDFSFLQREMGEPQAAQRFSFLIRQMEEPEQIVQLPFLFRIMEPDHPLVMFSFLIRKITAEQGLCAFLPPQKAAWKRRTTHLLRLYRMWEAEIRRSTADLVRKDKGAYQKEKEETLVRTIRAYQFGVPAVLTPMAQELYSHPSLNLALISVPHRAGVFQASQPLLRSILHPACVHMSSLLRRIEVKEARQDSKGQSFDRISAQKKGAVELVSCGVDRQYKKLCDVFPLAKLFDRRHYKRLRNSSRPVFLLRNPFKKARVDDCLHPLHVEGQLKPERLRSTEKTGLLQCEKTEYTGAGPYRKLRTHSSPAKLFRQISKIVTRITGMVQTEKALWKEVRPEHSDVMGDKNQRQKTLFHPDDQQQADRRYDAPLNTQILPEPEEKLSRLSLERPHIIGKLQQIFRQPRPARLKKQLILKIELPELMEDDPKQAYVQQTVPSAKKKQSVRPEECRLQVRDPVQAQSEADRSLELLKRFWTLSHTPFSDRMVLPDMDYPYGEQPLNFGGSVQHNDNWDSVYPNEFYRRIDRHPVSFGTGLGREEVSVDLAVLVDLINLLLLLWFRYVRAFWGWTGTQAVLGITASLYEYITLSTSRKEQDARGIRADYDRAFRWIRWEAEAVALAARDDLELHGNYHVGQFLEQLFDYMEDHHFDTTPIFRDVNKMDEWRGLLGHDLDTDITWVLDKIKGIRHQQLKREE